MLPAGTSDNFLLQECVRYLKPDDMLDKVLIVSETPNAENLKYIYPRTNQVYATVKHYTEDILETEMEMHKTKKKAWIVPDEFFDSVAKLVKKKFNLVVFNQESVQELLTKVLHLLPESERTAMKRVWLFYTDNLLAHYEHIKPVLTLFDFHPLMSTGYGVAYVKAHQD